MGRAAPFPLASHPTLCNLSCNLTLQHKSRCYKNNWLQKFSESSQENVYDWVHFSKVTNPQCTDYNAAIRRLHDRFFLEYTSKTRCLKKNTLRETYEVSALQYTVCNFIKKRMVAGLVLIPTTLLKKDSTRGFWSFGKFSAIHLCQAFSYKVTI